MDNRSAFAVNQYDENVRKVIPFYDEIYDQIFRVIETYSGHQPLKILDTGCGTGTFALKALKRLSVSEMVLCDPSEKMLTDAKRKLHQEACQFLNIGSEQLPFEESFDVVTAIQSHHYFTGAAREQAVSRCFRALKSGGLFICVENTAPLTDTGKNLLLRRLEAFEREAGRTEEEITAHSARYGREFFPITIPDHLELLRKTGFGTAELFWHSYMQSGFYALKD